MRAGIATALAAVLMASAALADGNDNDVLQYPASYFADARPATAYDMISRLPGFVFDSGQSARGFAGTAGNVLIDGQRPTSKTNDLGSILVRIPASDVERIDLIRGGAQGIDMQGQAVIANVVRKSAASTQLVIDVSDDVWTNGHQNPAASLQLTHRTGATTYEFALETSNSYDDSVGHGYYAVDDHVAGTERRYGVHYKNWGIGWMTTGAVTTPWLGGNFKANYIYQDSPMHSANAYYRTGDDFLITGSSGSKRGEIGLHWNGPALGGELEALALQRFGRDTDAQVQSAAGDDEIFWQRNRTMESIVRGTLRYPLSSAFTLETGWEGAYNQLEGTSTYTVNGTPVALPSANARVDEKRTEVFAQGTWAITPQWKLEAGARFEYSLISETGDTAMSREFFYPKPRVLLTWAPDSDTQIRVRAERVLGQLDFSNFIASSNLVSTGVGAGNPNLAPDRHWQYEIAFEQHFWDKGAVTLTLRHEDISGVLDYIPVFSGTDHFDAPGNIGGGHKNVIDLQTTVPLDRIGFTGGRFKSSTTWTLSGVRDPATGTTRRISGVRPRAFRFWLTQDIDSLKSTWSVFYYTAWNEGSYRPFLFSDRACIPPYIEVEWDYKPSPNWMFAVAAKNIGRFSYRNETDFYPGLRGATAPDLSTDYKMKSQARLYFEIRHTL
jgi:outer membrane receptor protein involved in Fe transport